MLKIQAVDAYVGMLKGVTSSNANYLALTPEMEKKDGKTIIRFLWKAANHRKEERDDRNKILEDLRATGIDFDIVEDTL